MEETKISISEIPNLLKAQSGVKEIVKKVIKNLLQEEGITREEIAIMIKLMAQPIIDSILRDTFQNQYWFQNYIGRTITAMLKQGFYRYEVTNENELKDFIKKEISNQVKKYFMDNYSITITEKEQEK